MRTRTMLRFFAFAAAVSILLPSCSGIDRLKMVVSSKPLAQALADPSLSPGTRKLLETARDVAAFSAERYGLSDAASRLRFLPGPRTELAWRLTVVTPRSVTPRSVSYFLDRARAERAVKKAEGKGDGAFIEPWNSLDWLGVEPSPLIAGLGAMPYDRLVEWINLELFASATAKSADRAVRQAFPPFAAEIATREYLASKLTPASPLLGNYLSEKRDERTFAALFPDYRSRFEGLYAQRPLPEDWQKLRQFLSSTWLQDYRDKYPDRFLTNLFENFGRDQPSDAEIAAWHGTFAGWGEWDKRYRESGEDLAALEKAVAKP